MNQGIDPRYRPPIPDGYIHWSNVGTEDYPGASLAERVAKMQQEGIPVEDILIDEFVPQDGYNRPMKAIFVKDRHVGKARIMGLMVEMMLKDLKGEEDD